MIVDDTTKPLLQRRSCKIDEQPNGLTGQAQICMKLLEVGLAKRFGAFDFDQQAVVDKQVNSECRRKSEPFELNVDRLLPIDCISHFRKLAGEYGLINAFQQPRSEFSMNSQGNINDVPADRINVSQTLPPRLRVSA